MKQRLLFFSYMAFFWLCFFELSRILFLVFHFQQSADLVLIDFVKILGLGLRMDAAMAGYWLILTGLLLTFSAWLKNNTVFRLHNIFTLLLLLVSCIIIVADLELYKHWGFRMNTTPLFYWSKEAAGSISTETIILLGGLLLLLMSSFYYFYWKILASRIPLFDLLPKSKSPFIFLFTALLFIPIRSSFDVAPLNTGAVYYHKTKTFPNHAGINVVWNFFKSLQSNNSVRYANNFFSGDAEQFITPWMDGGRSIQLVQSNQPNIILIILESFTAKIIEPLGGQPGVTPRLNALVKEGILFSEFYSSGDRTDKGLVSILSAYPAQPRTSIIKFPEKTQGLHFLPKEMNQRGYHSSFVYGGDAGFANMESYLTLAQFSHVTQKADFPDNLDQSKWGVADHFVFDKLLQEADSANKPFFKVMLSLSSHEPFEVPMKPVFEGTSERELFLNACYYTDKSLGEFIDAAKKKEWWNNTLIIITADHGHRFPNPEELKEKDRFKIPMLWLGGALTKKDTIVHTIANQTDIASTILGQLGGTKGSFKFSKDILAQNAHSFALYIFNNGYGLITPGKQSIYDFDLNNYLRQENSQEELTFGQAYLQALFTDYNSR